MTDARHHDNAGNWSTSRRQFLRATPWAAVGATVLAGQAHAETNSADAAAAPAVDVRRFGAAGDGRTDDTGAIREAIAHAKDQRAGTVFFPAGVYLLSGTLRLPSNCSLRGQGPGLTTLKAKADTLFEKFKPDPRTQDLRQRCTLITTESVATVRQQVTRHVTIGDMTIDWNHCPTGGFGHSVVLADSVDHTLLDNVHFIHCLPSDHPRRFEQMGGAGFRCECIMFSNARHGLMHRCSLTDSGYRPLSIAYNSKQIYFVNGIITATQPVWRHVFCENHGDGLPRDETFERSQIVFQNSTFVLEGGTGQDGICSHTGTTHVENCDFYINGGVTKRFLAIFRPFDGSRDCRFINNRFHCAVPIEHGPFPLLTTAGGREKENISFEGNIVRLTYAEPAEPWSATEHRDNPVRACLVDVPGGSPTRNIRVVGNHAVLHFKGRGLLPLFSLTNASGVHLGGNSIDLRIGDQTAEHLPDAVTLVNCRGGQVVNNVVTGHYRHGINMDEQCRQLIVTGNDVSEAAGDVVVGANASRRIIAENNISL